MTVSRDSINEILMQFDGDTKCVGGAVTIYGSPISSSFPKFGTGSLHIDGRVVGGSPKPTGVKIDSVIGTTYQRINPTDSNITMYPPDNQWSLRSVNPGDGTIQTEKYTTVTDPYLCFNFIGSKIRLIGTTSSLGYRSNCHILIDDKRYSFTELMDYGIRMVLFDIDGLEFKEHMVYIDGSDSSATNFSISGIDIDSDGCLLPWRLLDGYQSNYDGVSINSDVLSDLGNGDWTLSFWEYISSYSHFRPRWSIGGQTGQTYPIFEWGRVNAANNQLIRMSSGGASYGNIFADASLGAITKNTWIHWEISRNGTVFRVFKNGTLVKSTTTSITSMLTDSSLTFNINPWAYTGEWLIDELYFLKGTCLHTATFTSPTAPYEADWSVRDFTGIAIEEMQSFFLPFRKFQGFYFDDYLVNSKNLKNFSGFNIEEGIGIKSRNSIGHGIELINGISASKKQGVLLDDRMGGFRHSNSLGMYLPADAELGVKIPGIKQGMHVDIHSNGIKIPGIRQGVYVDNPAAGNRIHQFEGFELDWIVTDSNAAYKFNLLVTPTHQYKSALVGVSCVSKSPNELVGKCRLKIGNAVAIDYQTVITDVKNISYTISPAMLQFGSNTCRLEYLYQDGSIEYIEFIIVKEEKNRTLVERTFKSYDGGYDGNVFRPSVGSSLASCFCPPDGVNSTVIKTTDFTVIPLIKYTNLQGVTLEGNGLKVLVSFDKGTTWKSFISNVWKNVDIANIATYGMDVSTLNAITLAQWGTIFTPTQIDFAFYFDNTLSTYVDMGRAYLYADITKTPQTFAIIPPSNTGITHIYAERRLYGDNYSHIYLTINIKELINGAWSAGNWTGYRLISGTNLYYQGYPYGYEEITSKDYGANEANRSTGIEIYLDNNQNNPPQYSQRLAVTVAPKVSYIKGLTVQITPKISTGFAFIM